MLSQKNIDTIKATIPILEENGVALTKHFYSRMFQHNPEVKKFFNISRQKNSNQSEALAAAILAYARNIDNLDALSQAVEVIAQKHASLQIKPEHYPIVGTNLIESIKEMLNLSDSDDVIIAWNKAYNLLAEVLVSRENNIYREKLEQYGWNDFKEFNVVKKEKESINTYSFYLKNDSIDKFNFKPGQYITVRLPYENTTTMRNYSISSATNEDYLRITVKKEQKGNISQHLFNNINVGDTIEVASPSGEFFLDLEQKSDESLVFISAGIGITPFISMLLSELKTNNTRKIVFICGKKSKLEHPFVDLLKKLTEENSRLETIFFYENIEKDEAKLGVVNLDIVNNYLGNEAFNTQYFFCGPADFMLSTQGGLLKNGVNNENINFEFFGSKTF